MQRTTNSRRRRWLRRSWRPWSRRPLRHTGTMRVRSKRSRRRWIAVITAKRQPKPWRPLGWTLHRYNPPAAPCSGIRAPGVIGHSPRTYGGKSPESGRSGVVQPSQGHRRAGIWSDQGGARVPSFSAARFGQGAGRMALGLRGAQSAQAVALWQCLEDELSPSEPRRGAQEALGGVGTASGTAPLTVLR